MNKTLRNVFVGAGVVAVIAAIGLAVAKCWKEVKSISCDDEYDIFKADGEYPPEDVNIAPAQEIFTQGEEDEDVVNPTEAGNWSAT